MTKQILKFYTLFLVILATLTGCSWLGSSDKPKPTIVFVGTLSGAYAEYGKKTLDGVSLAFEDQNKLKLEVVDTKGSPKLAIEALSRLSKKSEVIGVIGEISSQMSLALAPAAQKLKIPMITPTSTNPEITKVGDYIFRFCFIDQFQGYAMARFASEELKLKKIAILKDLNSDYSRGLAQFFTENFKKLGGSVVMDEIYQGGDRDFKEQLSNIRRLNPDAIFLPGYFREVALIIRQARSMGIEATFLGGDGWDSKELFRLGRDSVKGSYFVNHFTAESKSKVVKSFVTDFQKVYKTSPDGLSARGYDAGKAVIQAFESSNSESMRIGLKEALAEISGFSGVTGSTTINTSRNAVKPAVILRVDGPMNRFITEISPPQKSE